MDGEVYEHAGMITQEGSSIHGEYKIGFVYGFVIHMKSSSQSSLRSWLLDVAMFSSENISSYA
jgi:hypothetical protein